MHLGALFIASHVLSSGSVRETARRFTLAASTVSAAVSNLESELALKLTERSSGELVTLIASSKVGEGLVPVLEAIDQLADFSASVGPVHGAGRNFELDAPALKGRAWWRADPTPT